MIFYYLYIIIKNLMKKLTTDEAIKKLSIKNPNVIFIDQYYSSRQKSKFECLICGCKWAAIPKGIIAGKNGCPECGKKKAAETIKYNITTDDFIEKLEKKFPNKFTILSDYVNHNEKIKIKCNICEHEWKSKPTCLLKGYGCYICGHKEKGEKQRKLHETFIKEIDKIYDNKLTVLSKYIKGKDRVDVKCNICNYKWSPISRILLHRGCPKCNFSKGELLIYKILKELKIVFKEQYIFDKLKTQDGGVPIFDFAIYDNSNNIKSIIEYDGEQHFKAVKRWGGINRLIQQQKVDEFKNDFCKKSNIKMIRIPYTELKNINQNYIKNLL